MKLDLKLRNFCVSLLLKIKEAYSSFYNYKLWKDPNQTKEGHAALEGLCSNKNIILREANKFQLF